MRSAIIFFVSVLFSTIGLLIERYVGIGWDYHPDSVTYATQSHIIVDNILNDSLLSLPNNAYYVFASLLNQNVVLITAANIILFALTNVVLSNLHWRATPNSRTVISVSIVLLIFNPYRMHLSTTLLKDTLIIFLLVMAVSSSAKGVFYWGIIILTRVAAILYTLILIDKKYYKYIIIVLLLFYSMFSDVIIDKLVDSNETDMIFREFDTIPNFREYGIYGTIIRAIVWPILALTGLFAVISPSLAYFPVALGCLFVNAYVYSRFRRLPFAFGILFSMAVFASLVTGFTSYIRYVYPIIVVFPVLLLVREIRNNQCERGPSLRRGT
jgi:hypothetical protein